MIRSGFLGLIYGISGLTLVFDIGDVSRVGISDGVGDNLGTTIGESYTVFTAGSITITVLILSKVGSRVVISDSIAILVDSGAIISGLMVSGSGVSGLVGGSWVSNNSGFVDNGGGFVSRSGFVSGSWVVDRSGFVSGSGVVDRSGLVVSGSWVVDGSGMVDGMVGTMVGKTVVGETMVGKTMVGKRVGNGCVDGDMGGSMDTCGILLLVVVLVNLIRGSGGLGVHG
jgi:hypothetical protein